MRFHSKKPWEAKYRIEDFLGSNSKIQKLRNAALRVAQTSATTLILGESGTGKELVAHAIHNASARKDQPFVWIECSSIPRDLFESELFGFESGAFTGADKTGKPGKFELADQGTVFLDEVCDMPLDMQAKVLRVLQENEIVRIGGTRPRRIDFRIIAATNKDIDNLVKQERFRNDLFYRLDVVRLKIPPLRERRDDILILAEHFLKFFGKRYGKASIKLSSEVIDVIENYNWPGNVRELCNLLENLVIFTDDDAMITLSEIPSRVKGKFPNLKESVGEVKKSIQEMERVKILEALRKTNYNKVKAAKLLGIHRSALYQKINKYGIHNV